MAEGLLPNFSSLAEQGSYEHLGTTCPPVSPVAWSSFSTGVNPGKHRIFDFYTRDPNNYLPVLSSVEIGTSVRKIGPFKFNIVNVKQLRRSESFWKILGDAGVFCSVLRVPITFEIRDVVDTGVLAHEQIVFIAEVPRKRRVLIAFVVRNARKAEIERTRFDQFPDT